MWLVGVAFNFDFPVGGLSSLFDAYKIAFIHLVYIMGERGGSVVRARGRGIETNLSRVVSLSKTL